MNYLLCLIYFEKLSRLIYLSLSHFYLLIKQSYFVRLSLRIPLDLMKLPLEMRWYTFLVIWLISAVSLAKECRRGFHSYHSRFQNQAFSFVDSQFFSSEQVYFSFILSHWICGWLRLDGASSLQYLVVLLWPFKPISVTASFFLYFPYILWCRWEPSQDYHKKVRTATYKDLQSLD